METLHRDIPEVEIDVVVKNGNEELFEHHPFIKKVFVWQKAEQKYRNLMRLSHAIRSQHYDKVINIQRFFSSGLLTLLAKAKETRGFSKNPLSFFFSKRYAHKISHNGFVHEIKRNATLIEGLYSLPVAKPHLYPLEERIFDFQNGIYYTISPSSLWETKQYPPEKWAELIKDAKGVVCLLGGKNDKELCERIIAASGNENCINMCGNLTFLQSCNVMKYAKMNFTNDSAPLHFCSAVNAPVTAVFCSTVPEFGFTPLSDDSLVVQTKKKLNCRPCGLHGFKTCPKGHFACANTINISDLTVRL
jgi:heptosyltransferase-2